MAESSTTAPEPPRRHQWASGSLEAFKTSIWAAESEVARAKIVEEAVDLIGHTKPGWLEDWRNVHREAAKAHDADPVVQEDRKRKQRLSEAAQA